jgi:hypothetical protein
MKSNKPKMKRPGQPFDSLEKRMNDKNAKKKRDPGKIAGDLVNRKIDQGSQKIIGSGKTAVGQAGKWLINKGGNKDLVSAGSKALIKHGSKFISQAAGKAKNFIHTEGKQALKNAAGYAKQKGEEFGNKVKGKWNDFTNKLKRKR